MIPHLFTMETNGDVIDAKGNIVARLSDDSHILDFLAGVRAAFDTIGQEIKGEIIRDGDWQAWEAATVRRIKGKRDRMLAEAGRGKGENAWLHGRS
jgi:hypothetical protein